MLAKISLTLVRFFSTFQSFGGPEQNFPCRKEHNQPKHFSTHKFVGPDGARNPRTNKTHATLQSGWLVARLELQLRPSRHCKLKWRYHGTTPSWTRRRRRRRQGIFSFLSSRNQEKKKKIHSRGSFSQEKKFHMVTVNRQNRPELLAGFGEFFGWHDEEHTSA